MASVNKVILIGNVGKDPECRSAQDGREIASFSLATSQSWKDNATGERKEKTEWHRVVVFNEGLVGVIKQYVKKGSKLYIEGQLQTRKWTDQGGNEKYSTEVVLAAFGGQLVMLGSPSGDGQQQAKPAQAAPAAELVDDEIPFAWLFAMAAGVGMIAAKALVMFPASLYA